MFENIGGNVEAAAAVALQWLLVAVPNLVAAVLLLIVGFWLAGWAQRSAEQMLSARTQMDATLRPVLGAAVRYAIIVVVLIAALGQLGVQTTSILAALGAAGLAIGLALQGTLANIAAGVMLLWLRPFRTGDYIDAEGVAGTVGQVGLFSTELTSWDGVYQFVPNAQIWNKHLVNYTRMPTRMVDLTFGVGYEDDIEAGKRILLQMAKADERVKAEPEAMVFVDALGDSAVDIRLRAWTATSDYWPVKRALTERGKAELEKSGLSIPFPQRDVHVIGGEGEGEAEAA